MLHDLPGSIDDEAELIEELGARRPVFGCDMIGNGNSDLPAGQTISIRLLAEHVAAVLDALGIGDVVILASGTAAGVAIELARTKSARVRGIVFRSPPAIEADQARALAPDYAPDITPQWDGGNFLRLWHHLRDQELWWPWNCRTVACARRTPPRIDPADLHRRAIALLRQPACYQAIWRAVLDEPLLERRGLGVPRRLVTHEQDVFAFAAERAARALFGPGAASRAIRGALAGVVADCLDEFSSAAGGGTDRPTVSAVRAGPACDPGGRRRVGPSSQNVSCFPPRPRKNTTAPVGEPYGPCLNMGGRKQ